MKSLKARYKAYIRSKYSKGNPPKPTSTILRSRDMKKMYRIWSDGSYRLLKSIPGKRTLIPV